MPRPVPERQELPVPRTDDRNMNVWGMLLVRTLMNVLSEIGQRLNRSINVDGEVTMNQPLVLATFTSAERPDAGDWEGGVIYVSDASAGSKFQGSNGSSWVSLG